MLDLARIILSNFRCYAERNEEIRELLVTCIDLVGDLHTLLRNRDKSGTVHLDIAFLAQTLHRVADTGLGYS